MTWLRAVAGLSHAPGQPVPRHTARAFPPLAKKNVRGKLLAMDHVPSGFQYRLAGDNVVISHNGRRATTLRRAALFSSWRTWSTMTHKSSWPA